MIEQTAQADQIRGHLRDSLRRRSGDSRIVNFVKDQDIYTCGDRATCSIYIIESGQVKLVTLTPEGKECILAIHAAGDIFGEACLAGTGQRLETATAMEDAVLRAVPCSQLLNLAPDGSLLEDFVRYLSVRIADQQEAITHLSTAGSEYRLGMTLLHLARKLGKEVPHGLIIEHKISHQDLSHMIGTTRPRISAFMQRFRELGLIDMQAQRLVVRDKELSDYLIKIEAC